VLGVSSGCTGKVLCSKLEVMKMIGIFKVIVALGFLAIAFAYITGSKIPGVPTEVFLMIFSIMGFIVLFLDHRNRQGR
jgi:hypothetical protein